MKRKDISNKDLQESKSVTIEEIAKIGDDYSVDIIKEQNDILKKEIIDLKKQIELLKRPKAEKLILSDETIIAELQLGHIKTKAMLGELTLEEIKKYDLLVKNKKLSEGNPTVITDYKRLPENIEEKDLILLASFPISTDTSE